MKDQIYYDKLEELANALTDTENFSPKAINEILTALSKELGVCRGTTTFFMDEEEERGGQGETLVCYDDGSASDDVILRRAEMPGGMIVCCQAEHPAGEEPWDDTKRGRIQTVIRLVTGYLARSRLDRLVNHLTMYDEAGYKNFSCFSDKMKELSPESLLQYAVIRFDLKHFSVINRELGREIADQVMWRYTTELEEAAGDNGLLCRLEGDDFVLLCDKDFLGSVISSLEGIPVFFSDRERVMVSATAGIYLLQEDAPDQLDEIMNRANSALAETQKNNRGDIVFYDDDLAAAKDRMTRIREHFSLALKNEEIKVYYQPKIDVRNNTMIGAEALSRWIQNDCMILPGEFIPILEQNNDICRLDMYVLERVCRDLSRWLKEGKNPVRISVNLSRRHLQEENVTEKILDIIDMYNVPHEYVEIELTETSTEVEFNKLKSIVGILQHAGVYTAVDDFGMGYSSLKLIRDIPWNVIKVDRNFVPVNQQDEGTTQGVMFRNVVNMVREMGRESVIEGVETWDQVKVLLENGCTVAQGFFYDRALPVDAFEKRLDHRRYSVTQAET